MHASWHGCVEAVEVLLQASAKATTVRIGGTTALMDACAGGHERVAAKLLDAGAPIDAADAHGLTALMHAARAGHDVAMVPLLQRLAALNVKDKEGRTALAHAATEECFQRLLASGANPKSRTAPPPAPRQRHRAIAFSSDGAAGSPAGANQQPTRRTSAPPADWNGKNWTNTPGANTGRAAADGAKSAPAPKGGAGGSPWSIGADDSAAKKKADGNGLDFLRVRPRGPENMGSGYGKEKKERAPPTVPTKVPPAAALSAGQRASAGVAAAPARKGVDPIEARREGAARMLQMVFKLRFLARLRAEAKLFGLLKLSGKELTNHWHS